MPSRRNSGFTHTVNPSFTFRPELCSRIGTTMLSVVPGNTVLRTTIV